jgi:hydroxyacid-oxoacid transhydrogenase
MANLYAIYPADFLAYVSPPIGQGRPIPGRLQPLIAVPTTAGTGSETTGVAIFDYLEIQAKTGITHPTLRPTLGIVDPLNTLTLPPMVIACTGWDVLCHALESLTALPYHQRPAAGHPNLRPAYQGANPISDVWAARAIVLVVQAMVRVLRDPGDVEARGQMALAAAFAGIGFGNAGVHLPHGMAITLNAPAVFHFTAAVNPERHLYATRLMGVDISGAAPEDTGEILAHAFTSLMRRTDMPNGLSAVGYGPEHIDDLVAGTLPQHRVTKLSPRPAAAEDLGQLFQDSMVCW